MTKLRSLAGLMLFALAAAASWAVAQDAQSIRELRLARLTKLNAARQTDLAVTNAALMTRWPDAMRAQVVEAVNAAIELQPEDAELQASAVRAFVEWNGEAPPSLRKYLRSALPNDDRGDKYDLLRAVRALGFDGAEFQDLARAELAHSSDVVRLVAASALCRIDPNDVGPLSTIERALREESAGTLWRAADAAGHCGVAEHPPLLERLKELLIHDDVRIRVTAAAALWRLTKDVDATLPILRRAMAVADEPLAIGFVYPSNLGASHRIYVIEVLGEMRLEGAAPVLDDLVAAVEDVAFGVPEDAQIRLVIGLTALGTLARCEQIPEEVVAKVRAASRGETSVYGAYPDLTEPLLDELSARVRDR